MTDGAQFDYVIVGAGAAGCVLARRLTEDADCTVALVEAGPDYGPDPLAWPAAMRDATASAADVHSWGYVHAGRPPDQPRPLPRARIVGGSTAINACAWLHGSAADYDAWAAMGNPGWSFDDLRPYFRRSEADPLGGAWHGSDGPVPITRTAAADLSPVDRAFVASAERLGIPWVADFNGRSEQSPGVGPMPKNIAGGVRMNAAFTYLTPARSRPNLTLLVDTLVDRVLIADGRALGVLTASGQEVQGREIILCAGSYGSPAILMRSGIGPAKDLQSLGIPVLLDRPGVGGCLHDHPILPNVRVCPVAPGMEPGAAPFAPLALMARSSRATREIDLILYQAQTVDPDSGALVCSISVSLQHAYSRGRMRLSSPDPEAPPEIDLAHLSDPRDLAAIVDGIALINRLIDTTPLADALERLQQSDLTSGNDEAIRSWARAHVTTTHHPSSTCRMGPSNDPTAVVDQAGRVYGIAGLRVADASIFPAGPRANLHAPVVAVAEKLADTLRSVRI